MNFASDNITGAAPEILAALQAANGGTLMPYGNDDVTKAAEAKVAGIFETEADVFFVATGTAANALALSVMTPPTGAVFCHLGAHLNDTECGAPEFFTGGAKLLPLDGVDGKFTAEDLEAAIAASGVGNIHHCQAAAVTITQATETGSLYSLDEIKAISKVCKAHGLKLHMDGSRFSNAVAALGCSAADLTWKAGVDVLSFGATKNGGLTAEAVVLFDRSLSKDFGFRRKRGGHLFSKMRLLAAQMDAYVTDELWLKNARQANANAARMAAALDTIDGIEQSQSVQANILFPRMPRKVIQGLQDDGFLFYERGGKDIIRLVMAFDTRGQDIDAFIDAARRHAGG
ncbi:MAG: low specificity L-threonine aldolase [Alphaproteobacteria bacterium]|nr:low specificity L-threonine aldolase [Alphaproteobacteria bacterium]MBT7942125.1 low specificity L-threonine aldolase [Alphaproteobacteria bacterium]